MLKSQKTSGKKEISPLSKTTTDLNPIATKQQVSFHSYHLLPFLEHKLLKKIYG